MIPIHRTLLAVRSRSLTARNYFTLLEDSSKTAQILSSRSISKTLTNSDGSCFLGKNNNPYHPKNKDHTTRWFSSVTPPSTNASSPERPYNTSPKALTIEMAMGCQDATQLFLRHGLGMRRLNEISKGAGDVHTLVERWQRMMEAFLGTQVHVLAGLGYSPDEAGLALYNTHLAMLLQNIDPDTQETIRLKGRDLWRQVLSMAFNVPLTAKEESGPMKELSIVDARNIMYKVSQRMTDSTVLDSIRDKCSALEPMPSEPMQDMARKHNIIQNVLVHEVYLNTYSPAKRSLVVECGFEDGEKGYVRMQCVMAEHQKDPLIAQYIGTAMMHVLQAAGLDLGAIQKAAAESSVEFNK